MPKKKKHEEHENHERWLVSYADFITLLFAFFVVMYSVSSVNEGKYRVLSESIEASFRTSSKSLQPIQIGQVNKSIKTSPGFGKSPVIALGLADLPAPRFSETQPVPSNKKNKKAQTSQKKINSARMRRERIKRLSSNLNKALAPLISQGLVSIEKGDEWIEVEMNSSILFPSGSAQLARQSIPVLERIASILKTAEVAIHVEGFTDNVPIKNIIYPSNWELSAARAASVVHLLTQSGVNPKHIAAVGFGEYQPVASNNTATGRRKNRRVVLIINADPSPRLIKKKKASTSTGETPEPAAVSPDTKPSKTKSTQTQDKRSTQTKTKAKKKYRHDQKESVVRKGKFRVFQDPIVLPAIPKQ